ncbi:MAG: DNA translocase FtsK, partial [Dehalococcoidia bacterium]|nr:DNA translocase FtsK [Dehalococcoidia bacterium]
MSKARSGSKSGRKAKESRPAGKRFFAFIAAPVVRRLILIVVIVVLLYVLWDRMLALFGYGLIIIAIALGLLFSMAWRWQFSVVKRRWNWILGGISLALAVWGILAFFPGKDILKDATLGGSIGQSIIMHSPDEAGGLLVAGLVLLGIIFIIPGKCWSAAKDGWRLLTKAFRRASNFIFRKQAPATATALEATSTEVGVVDEAEATSTQRRERSAPPMWKSEHEPILTPGGWHLPPIDIMDKPAEVKLDKDAIDQRARLIEEALVSYGVEAKVVQINIGPTVTQFGVEPGWDKKYREVREKGKNGSYETKVEEVSRIRVRVDRITSLANDLALALAAPSIRIEAPVPGAPVVGIEVPNTVFGSVALRGAIESAAFQKIKARSKLAIALGKGAGGEAVA